MGEGNRAHFVNLAKGLSDCGDRMGWIISKLLFNHGFTDAQWEAVEALWNQFDSPRQPATNQKYPTAEALSSP